MSQPIPPAQPRYSPDIDREFAALNRKACLCELATKVAGCICLPLTYACCCITCERPGGGSCSGKQHPETHKYYAKFSSVETCAALPRLPPKDCSDRICQIWDPCVCLICYANETAQHYLNPKDQARWEELYLPPENNQIVHRAEEGFLERGVNEPALLALIGEYMPRPQEFEPPPREVIPVDMGL